MNEGFLELGLLNVQNEPAQARRTRVSFRRGASNEPIGDPVELAFPPLRRFKLPAFPQAHNLLAQIAPERYKTRNSGFFTLTDGETIRRNLTIFRAPGKWQAEYTPWRMLLSRFHPLKDVLSASRGLKIKQGASFDLFTEDDYDEVQQERDLLAKTALLNLYAVLPDIKEPTTGALTWFSFGKRIFLLDRERCIAQVEPRMGQLVRTINQQSNQFPDYRPSSAAVHFPNSPPALPPGFTVTQDSLISVKTKVERGNLQLTVASGKDAQNNPLTLLDADIDENHELARHIADVFKHLFTGGTHPFDIHEILHLFAGQTDRRLDLGYRLV